MIPALSPRQQAIQFARQKILEQPIFLDTETTGLDKNDEIVEISLVSHEGQVLFESLVKPTRPIPNEVTRLHHITNEMVTSAPAWPVVWSQVRPFLIGHTIAIYNADYDLRLIQQSFARYRLSLKDKLNSFCIMKLYAEFYGEWDPGRRSYRYQSLDKARQQCGLSLPNTHRAADDALLARALLHYIGDYKG